MAAFLHALSERFLEAALAAENRKARLTTASLTLNGAKLSYLQRPGADGNTSEAIVMLHGAASDNTCWARVAALIESPLPLLAPDLPGHGSSGVAAAADLGIAAQAANVVALFQALGVARAHLIGNSMGGAIALHLAATQPSRVASLVLIDSAGAETTSSWLRATYSAGKVNPMFAIEDVKDYRNMVNIGMSKPPYIPGFLMAALARRFAARRELNARIERDLYADLDQKHLLKQITAPALIVWGEEDKIVHVDDAELLHQALKGSSKVVLPGVGHVPMVEAPKQLAALCNEFYARLGQAGRLRQSAA